MIIERHAVSRQPVEVGCLHIRVAVAPQGVGALVIGHEIDDVGLPRYRRRGKAGQQSQYQDPKTTKVWQLVHCVIE